LAQTHLFVTKTSKYSG